MSDETINSVFLRVYYELIIIVLLDISQVSSVYEGGADF